VSGLFPPALGKVPGLRRIQKYGPLLGLPLDQHYYSRAADPFSIFNRQREKLYSTDFNARVARNGSRMSLQRHFAAIDNTNALEQMLYVDTKTWLPDDLLVKADKMTMANSVELRVPLLDHHVLEFAAALPSHYKVKGWTTKRVLKAALRQRVPEEILTRTKTGFPVPYERWIRNDFRDPIRDILTDRRTVQRGYFRRQTIESLLEQNSPQCNYSKEIFSLVVLELWHRIFAEQRQVVMDSH
jgi:asparagine synthase (glutamine-hydrolysing)